MTIKGFKWAGIRTDDIETTVQFYRDVLGLSLVRRNDDHRFAVFTLPSGQEFEVFWQGSKYYPLHAQPVIAFDVDDIRAVRQALETQGVEFLTDILVATSGALGEEYAWCYFRDPNGYTYELYQQPDAKP